MEKIKFLVMDVDGTLTDGKVYMGVEGEAIKVFDIKDGYAMGIMLPENGIIPVVITARESAMVEHRCKELGVAEIHQGVRGKLDCLRSIIEKYSTSGNSYNLANCAYIGDDLLDIQCMLPIKKAGGVVGCPSDAVKEVKAVCDFVAPHKGGEGAVRDFVEFLLGMNETLSDDTLEKRCMEVVDYLSGLQDDTLELGRHDVYDGFFYNVLEYRTFGEQDKPFESHRQYVDIQMLVVGEEVMQITDVERLQKCTEYDVDKDVTLYKSSITPTSVVIRPGSVIILYPRDAHRSIATDEHGSLVRKIVGKLRIH